MAVLTATIASILDNMAGAAAATWQASTSSLPLSPALALAVRVGEVCTQTAWMIIASTITALLVHTCLQAERYRRGLPIQSWQPQPGAAWRRWGSAYLSSWAEGVIQSLLETALLSCAATPILWVKMLSAVGAHLASQALAALVAWVCRWVRGRWWR